MPRVKSSFIRSLDPACIVVLSSSLSTITFEFVKNKSSHKTTQRDISIYRWFYFSRRNFLDGQRHAKVWVFHAMDFISCRRYRGYLFRNSVGSTFPWEFGWIGGSKLIRAFFDAVPLDNVLLRVTRYCAFYYCFLSAGWWIESMTENNFACWVENSIRWRD